MSPTGPTGYPPQDGAEVQAALADISLAVHNAVWRLRGHHQAQQFGPTGFGPTGPSLAAPKRTRARERA